MKPGAVSTFLIGGMIGASSVSANWVQHLPPLAGTQEEFACWLLVLPGCPEAAKNCKQGPEQTLLTYESQVAFLFHLLSSFSC